MLTATFLAIFMIPMFFVVIAKFGKTKTTPGTPPPPSSGQPDQPPRPDSNSDAGMHREGH
jgi:multidrug efflux pump